MTPRAAAFFDVDKTLVRVNTGQLYMRFRMRKRQAGPREVLRFTRWMTQYSLGIVDIREVTTKALEAMRGVEESRFRDEMHAWYEAYVRRHVSLEGRREVVRRRAAGAIPVILSASTPYAVEPLAEDLGIEHVLCTTLEVRDGKFTGRTDRLCYGEDKVHLAEEWARAHGVDLAASSFYTDSVSDVPMLERVGEPRVVNPDPRLRVRAAARRWPVERWR